MIETLLKGINSVEGLVFVAMTLAFILIIRTPVLKALREPMQDPVVVAIADLTESIDAMIKVSESQLQELRSNNKYFDKLQERLLDVHGTLVEIKMIESNRK